MRAKDVWKAGEVARKLRQAYADRAVWQSSPEAIKYAKLFVENDNAWDEIEIAPSTEMMVLGRAASEARIADLEQQLDAMGVKDLYTLQEAEDEDGEDEDEDDLEEAA